MHHVPTLYLHPLTCTVFGDISLTILPQPSTNSVQAFPKDSFGFPVKLDRGSDILTALVINCRAPDTRHKHWKIIVLRRARATSAHYRTSGYFSVTAFIKSSIGSSVGYEIYFRSFDPDIHFFSCEYLFQLRLCFYLLRLRNNVAIALAVDHK